MFWHRGKPLAVVLFAAWAAANSNQSTAAVPDAPDEQAMAVLRRDDRWGPENHLLRGCIVVERDSKRIRGDYELIVELQNQCGHAAIFDFDPKDLKVEIFDAAGKPIDEPGTNIRSGPVPQPHHGVISPGTHVGLTTHRGGIPFGRRGALFAAGWQCWTLAPGKYRLKATASVALQHADKALEPLLPTRSTPSDTILPVGTRELIRIDLGETTFEIPAADANDDAWSKPVNGLRARLHLLPPESVRRTPFLRVLLELENTSDVAGQRRIRFEPSALQLTVSGEDGQTLAPNTDRSYSGSSPDWSPMLLPYAGALRFQISFPGLGYRESDKAIIDVDGKAWVIGDDQPYFLSGALQIPLDSGKTRHSDWSGALELPPVRIAIPK